MLKKMEQSTPTDETNALHRIKTQQLNRLTNTLAATTNEFFKGQAEYMEKVKSRMRTQLEVTKGTNDLNEEEIKDILQKDSYSAFTQDFISETQDAETQLRQIEDRQKAILALEKSVFEVNQLFKDMSLLVHDQGEVLDCIEANMVPAAADVEKGKMFLYETSRKQRKSRRWKLCFGGIALVVVVVVVAALLIAFL